MRIYIGSYATLDFMVSFEWLLRVLCCHVIGYFGFLNGSCVATLDFILSFNWLQISRVLVKFGLQESTYNYMNKISHMTTYTQSILSSTTCNQLISEGLGARVVILINCPCGNNLNNQNNKRKCKTHIKKIEHQPFWSLHFGMGVCLHPQVMPPISFQSLV